MYLKILWKLTKSKAGNRYPGIEKYKGPKQGKPKRLHKNHIVKNSKI